MTPAATTSRRGASAKPRGKRDDFSGVDCVTIDSEIQESKFDDSPATHYVHVWVDGDKNNKDNKRYLSVREDQADWISSNQGKILKPIDWMVEGGKTWLCPTPENTQVFTTVVPDSNPFEEDDVNRLYEQEPDPELDISRESVMAEKMYLLMQKYPWLRPEDARALVLSTFISDDKR